MREAYADCHQFKSEGVRNLDWMAEQGVPRDQAIYLFRRYVGSYNNFRAELLEALPAASMVIPAREGGVCVYVYFPGAIDTAYIENMKYEMNADEADIEKESSGLVRFWWD